MSLHDWAELGKNGFSGVAFLLIVWLVHRVFKFTIPRLAQDFREINDAQRTELMKLTEDSRAEFIKALNEQRKEFISEIKDQRVDTISELRRLTEKIDKLLETVRINRG